MDWHHPSRPKCPRLRPQLRHLHLLLQQLPSQPGLRRRPRPDRLRLLRLPLLLLHPPRHRRNLPNCPGHHHHRHHRRRPRSPLPAVGVATQPPLPPHRLGFLPRLRCPWHLRPSRLLLELPPHRVLFRPIHHRPSRLLGENLLPSLRHSPAHLALPTSFLPHPRPRRARCVAGGLLHRHLNQVVMSSTRREMLLRELTPVRLEAPAPLSQPRPTYPYL
mmetsp:Transcript_8782/g.17061  ORF Transcript_8782/g.17061 Transcript_8782/m.17061 type:complete len:218 (-) Transcript_8782:742-1395(-)